MRTSNRNVVEAVCIMLLIKILGVLCIMPVQLVKDSGRNS